MIKKTFLGLLTGLLFFSCSDDDDKDISIDFEINVVGDAPNAQLQIVNNTTNADSYSWSFGEGSNIPESNEKSLSVSVYKAGEFEVALTASNGSSTQELTKKVIIPGNSAILVLTDLEFALDKSDASIGCLYSFEDEKMYKPGEINDNNVSNIGLGFGSMANTMYFFLSPGDDYFNISGASETLVVNYEQAPSISVGDFDTMVDDEVLSALTINGTNDSFGNSEIPGTVLFQLANGKKGVIKTKAVNSERILADIKLQKY